VNGVAHFADDVVAAQSDFHAEGDFFKQLAVGGDGCDAQVGAAEIDSDGKIVTEKIIRIAATVVALLMMLIDD
jgi:hypothetical protein